MSILMSVLISVLLLHVHGISTGFMNAIRPPHPRIRVWLLGMLPTGVCMDPYLSTGVCRVLNMKCVASSNQELTVEEHNLLSVAYKNVIGLG